MSRHLIAGKDPQHRLVVGVDAGLPQPSFFGQVIRLPETDDEPLVWVGGSIPPLRDLGQVVSALQPYGEISLALQLQMLEELDQAAPYSLSALGQQLAAICQQEPQAHLTLSTGTPEQVVLVLHAQGWQVHSWSAVAHRPHELMARMLFPDQPVSLDYLSGYASDRSTLFAIHGEGMNLGLPVWTIFRRGAALCGPVAISTEASGLTAQQVQVVQQEVLWVPDRLRSQVSTLWYRACRTLASRGW